MTTSPDNSASAPQPPEAAPTIDDAAGAELGISDDDGANSFEPEEDPEASAD